MEIKLAKIIKYVCVRCWDFTFSREFFFEIMIKPGFLLLKEMSHSPEHYLCVYAKDISKSCH